MARLDQSATQSAAKLPTRRIVMVLAATLLLSGCMSAPNRLRPLTPVPTTAVSATALPAPITFGQDPAVQSQSLDAAAGIDPNAPVDVASLDGTQPAVAPLTAPAGASAVTEDDLIGAWSAATPSATCSINLSLTTGQGGYRASTRNCADVQVAGLTAWSIEGQQVILKGAEGATLGRLYRTGPTRYAGQLETGQALTVFR